MKKKRILLITVIFALLICFFFFLPKEVKQPVKKKIKSISYEHPEYKERYTSYKSKHPHLTKEEIVTLVNMNRDFDFYGKIIKKRYYNKQAPCSYIFYPDFCCFNGDNKCSSSDE